MNPHFLFGRGRAAERFAFVAPRFKIQGSLLFVTYTIIQGIISSEM